MSRQSGNSTFYFLGKKGMKSETNALLKKSGKNENYGSQVSILKLVPNAV